MSHLVCIQWDIVPQYPMKFVFDNQCFHNLSLELTALSHSIWGHGTIVPFYKISWAREVNTAFPTSSKSYLHHRLWKFVQYYQERPIEDQTNVVWLIYMWFPTMWHFDKCRLRRACAASLKLRNLKWCSVSSLTLIGYLSDQQRLWSDCVYGQADMSLCWSHIPHRVLQDAISCVLYA